MKKLILSLFALLLAAPVAAQDFRHRYFHYDQYFTPPLSFYIKANSADGADNRIFCLSGGGEPDRNRGAWLCLDGNEHGSPGLLALGPGNVAGGNLQILTGNNYTRLTIPYLADADDVDLVLGSTATTAPVFTIRGQTADGDDDGTLRLAAGGGSTVSGGRGAYMSLQGADVGGADLGGHFTIRGGAGKDGADFSTVNIGLATADGADYGATYIQGGATVSNTRGAYILVYGNENGAAPGAVSIAAGNTAGLGNIAFATGAGYAQWQIPRQTAATSVGLAFGSSASANAVTATIYSARDTDGTDDDILCLSGGGACANTARGGYIKLYGNEDAGAGDIDIISGNSAGSAINISASPATGVIYFGTNGSQRWLVEADGDLAQEATNGGNIVLDKDAVNTIGQTNAGKLFISGNSNDEYLEVRSGDKNSGSDLILATGVSSAQILFRGTSAANDQIALWEGLGTRWAFGTGVNFHNGSAINIKKIACEAITIAVGSGAAGVVSGTNLCASGTILGLGVRVTDAPGGGATTFDVGCTGSGNLDQFCDGVSSALNTTCAYPTDGDGTNTPWVQKTATTMTVTTDANVTGDNMIVRVCPYYFDTTAPTS